MKTKLTLLAFASMLAGPFYASQDTAHEWQSWRRSLHEFAPLLFKD